MSYGNRRRFHKGFSGPRVHDKRDMAGTEYSDILDSDLYYLEDGNVIKMVSQNVQFDVGTVVDPDEDGKVKAVGGAVGTDLVDKSSIMKASMLSSPGYRFARIFARQFSNQKNVYSRCLSMLSIGNFGRSMQRAWIGYMNTYKTAHDSKVCEFLSSEYDRLAGERRSAEVTHGCCSDEEETKQEQGTNHQNRDLDVRASNRVKIIRGILEHEAVVPLHGGTYIDYGGNMWHNATAVHEAFKMKDTYVVDIINKRPDHPDWLKYIQLPQSGDEPFRIPLDDGSVDLITMFMVAHHINDLGLTDVLGEFARILKPGGVVIVREHDLVQTFEDTDDRPALKDLFDALHFMHSAVWKSETDFVEQTNYEDMGTIYRAFDKYESMFKHHGLVQYKPPYILRDFRKNIYNTGTLSFIKK